MAIALFMTCQSHIAGFADARGLACRSHPHPPTPTVLPQNVDFVIFMQFLAILPKTSPTSQTLLAIPVEISLYWWLIFKNLPMKTEVAFAELVSCVYATIFCEDSA